MRILIKFLREQFNIPLKKNALNPFYMEQHYLFNKRQTAFTQFISQKTRSTIGSMYWQLN